MSRSIGRLFFVAFIWIYSLVYFLECLKLESISEKMTVVAVFWLLSAFVLVELIILIRSLIANKDLRHPFSKNMAIKIIRDAKTQLAVAIVLYLMAIPYFGFYSASFFAFCTFSFILGTRGVFKMVVPALVVLLVIYLIFSFSLKLTLPQGLIF